MSAVDYVLDVIHQVYNETEKKMMEDTEIRQKLEELMAAGKSIPCTCPQCPAMREDGTSSNNVKYSIVRKGKRLHCKACRHAFTCVICHEVCHIEEAAYGLYKGACIDCTRCEECGVPMWDYVCKCQVY